VIAELLAERNFSQSELARRIGVSQQTISSWLAGGVESPTIHTVRAVYDLSGNVNSMLWLISRAYGWPLEEIAQNAVLDAVIADHELGEDERRHMVDQYGLLLRSTRTARNELFHGPREPAPTNGASDDVDSGASSLGP
jgi:transcriptional regulator with XRE-family HTH domain